MITGLAIGEYDLPERNELARQTIESYAFAHAGTDACIGAAGFLPIPGAGPASIIAALAAQLPFYRGLAKDLSNVYQLPLDAVAARIRNGGILADSGMTTGVDAAGWAAGEFLQSQFTSEFLTEIGWQIASESGVGILFSAIPVIGGLASMGLDVAIAATMTWRVGTMISAYYQNGAKWVNSRKHTYLGAKNLTGNLSPSIADRVDLNDLRREFPELNEHQIEQAAAYAKDLLEMDPSAGREKLRSKLERKGFPADIADEAVKRANDPRGRRW